VQLVYPVLDDLRKEIAGLKSFLQEVEAEVCDLKSKADVEFQHVRANQMAIQKVADATGNHQIDTEEECEMYNYERHREYLMTRRRTLGYDAAGNQTLGYEAAVNPQVPVSDPHLEL
ncbi:hypothetical protein DFH28DRAFT_878381, partial [Melampsora americana]